MREQQFTEIWRNASWGYPRSGAYALPKYTNVIRRELPRVIMQLKIKSMFDGPCGDYSWMREVDLPSGTHYIGGDIVRPMINDLREFYPDVDFRHHDLVRQPFPDVDLWFCRDGLYLLDWDEIGVVLRRFLDSPMNYMMCTSHFNEINGRDPHPDRQQNLCIAPFNFPEPLEWIDDWFDDPERPGLNKRRMGIWSRAQLFKPITAFKPTV